MSATTSLYRYTILRFYLDDMELIYFAEPGFFAKFIVTAPFNLALAPPFELHSSYIVSIIVCRLEVIRNLCPCRKNLQPQVSRQAL